MKYVLIKNIKALLSIFKNLINEFKKEKQEKHEAFELIKKVENIGGYNVMILEKSKEFLNSLNNDLASWTIYANDFKTLTAYNKTTDYICILKKVISSCCNTHNSMSKKFKQRNFEGVKEECMKLIKDLRYYEKRHNIKLF